MPTLVPAVLRRLLAWKVGAQGACLIADGWNQPLPMGLERAAALTQGETLADAGERSLRSLLMALALEQVTESEWRAIDPEGVSLRDIDRPDDMDAWVGARTQAQSRPQNGPARPTSRK
jgi:molybdopterin-guanine dinucleotide biosynthesis protein A